MVFEVENSLCFETGECFSYANAYGHGFGSGNGSGDGR